MGDLYKYVSQSYAYIYIKIQTPFKNIDAKHFILFNQKQ